MPKAVIIHNKSAGGDFYKIALKWKHGVVKPGQFVMLRVTGSYDPLLRRPFGVYDVLQNNGGVEIFYKVVGKGTSIMSGLMPGDTVDVLGPLGNGFPMPSVKQNLVMVAGGAGIAPFYLLAKNAVKKNVKVTLLYGARNSKEVKIAADFKKLGVKVKVSTEDGSVGKKGFITSLLEAEFKENTAVYACGPIGMLKEVSRVSAEHGVKSYVSLERSMACGIGVCLGCAVLVSKCSKGVEIEKGYDMVCSDGPVFKSEVIEWERL
ncbi:MAG: dihydroorotate dehydrogenase electron transfer subunit [Thermodesulfobacteriota bacterium]